MPNNLSIKDASAAPQSLKTTETTGVHTPHHIIDGTVAVSGPLTDTQLRAAAVSVALDNNSLSALENIQVTFPSTQNVSVQNASLAVTGTVTANTGLTQPLTDAQLRLTAVPVSGTFWPATQPVSLDSVPSHPVTGSGSFTAAQATAANLNATVVGSGSFTAAQATASNLKAQAQILNSAGSLITYAESGTYGNPSVDVISVQNPQGTSATATTFTSTTASSVLVSALTSRKVLTVFNAGAGILYISPTSTATTTSFQIRLASGDYWECPDRQVTMAHRAVFDTAGTAYITSIS